MAHDPIADMLTIIRNAIKVKKLIVEFNYSKTKHKIVEKLFDNQYIIKYQIKENENVVEKKIIINLKYVNNISPITNLKRISKPGLRVYVNKNDIPRVLNGLGMAILSTSKGILSDNEARKQNVGGEVLLYIW